jgi:hypothetical protein
MVAAKKTQKSSAPTDKAAGNPAADAANTSKLIANDQVARSAESGDAGPAEPGDAGAADVLVAVAAEDASAELVASAPQTETPAPGASHLYEVLSPLRHDGQLYEPRDGVELTAEESAPLVGHTVRAVAPGTPLRRPILAGQPVVEPRLAYRVLSPLDHDGKRRAVGAELQLTQSQAAPLLGHTVELKGE